MKNTMKAVKKILNLVLVVIINFGIVTVMDLAVEVSATSRDATFGNYYYTVTVYDTVTITRFFGDTNGYVTIPSTIDGYKVTKIDGGAFSYIDSITSVIIPDTITSIGGNAFYRCNNLVSVTLPDGLTEIKDYTFYCCDSLKSIIIPSSVSEIGFEAFYGCDSLVSVTIQEGVTYIGPQAFGDCYSLTSITIPKSVTGIGYEAFVNCDSITKVIIPDSVSSLALGAFASCDELTSIEVDPNNAYYSSVDGVLFNKNKTHLIEYIIENTRTSYIIPKGVTKIGREAFAYSDSLTSVTIQEGVTDIGYQAFAYCGNLTSITIPKSVTNIYSSSFDYCDNLKDVYYEGSEERWKKIYIDSSVNDGLSNANIHFTEEKNDEQIESSSSSDSTDVCSCRCHKDNFFAKLIWNIVNFFNKFFRNNKICSCGGVHW